MARHVRNGTSPVPSRADISLAGQQLQEVLACVEDAVVLVDAHDRLLSLNPAAERLTGWPRAAAEGALAATIVRLGGVESAAEGDLCLAWAAVLASGQAVLEGVAGPTPVEGSICPLEAGDGTRQGHVLVLRDLSAVRRLVGQVSHLATHDALTDLINRQEFERLLGACLADTGPHPAGHALLYLDLDQFKVINDTCGHAAGDLLLRQVTARLRHVVRQSDELARLGGDEFGVLLRDCPLGPALRVAESLREAIRNFRFRWTDRSFALSASLGLVHFAAGETAADTLSAADAACYIAKDKGRNRIHVHDRADADTARRRGELDWASRIDGALNEDRFVLYGQRIAPVEQRAGNGHYELLVRMRDEAGKLVPPMAFLPAAERYGLMAAIDRWVVRSAFATLAHARARGALHLRFAINLSAASINDEAFLPFLHAQFDDYAIPHVQIGFEVTETAAIANLASAARMIDALRALGCTFSLDDFGSGMSSFAYLKHLRIDYLKIDGAFVRDIATDRADAAMVEAIHRVGEALGLQTIAEFVENEVILARLRALGVHYAQGYGIHVPQPLTQILTTYLPAPAA
jgi:diguanylate cyclase (GGDEF)-like protein